MFRHIFVTGDTHGEFNRVIWFCEKHPFLTKDDIVIILGDAGLNYYGGLKDSIKKNMLAKCPCTFVCIHGNHEERPCNVPTYKKVYVETLGCECWVEDDFPNILFPDDGLMTIDGLTFLVLGGAYSVDKWVRLTYGWNWFPSEQMTDETMDRIRELVKKTNKFDYVLSHTCPLKFEPSHLFLRGVDQSKVDKRMERFLDEIEESITYDHWLFGHYHSDEMINDKVQLMFNSFIEVEH